MTEVTEWQLAYADAQKLSHAYNNQSWFDGVTIVREADHYELVVYIHTPITIDTATYTMEPVWRTLSHLTRFERRPKAVALDFENEVDTTPGGSPWRTPSLDLEPGKTWRLAYALDRTTKLFAALSGLLGAFPELTTAPTTQEQQDALRAAREALR